MEACVVFTLCLVVEKDISYIKLHYMYTYIFHNQYRYQLVHMCEQRKAINFSSWEPWISLYHNHMHNTCNKQTH